jgi:hypothetical protein
MRAIGSAFTVVLTYRDADHERLAKLCCQKLAEDCNAQRGLTVHEWKFEMLAVPGLSQMAAVDAANAAVIVISTCRGEELPVEVKGWLDRVSLIEGPLPRSLVVLLSDLHPYSEISSADRSYLESVTTKRRTNIQFPDAPMGGTLRADLHPY